MARIYFNLTDEMFEGVRKECIKIGVPTNVFIKFAIHLYLNKIIKDDKDE